MTTEAIVVNPKEYGLEETKANELTIGLKPIIEERDLLIKEFNDVSKLEVTEENLPIFKELRLKIVRNRTQGINKWHKANKDFFLTGGRFVDAIKNKEIHINETMEEKLMDGEKYFERLEFERLEKLQQKRVSLIYKYIEEAELRDFRGMDEDVWEMYFKGKKTDYENRIAGEKLAEQQRIAEEKRLEAERLEAKRKQREENERIRLENEKLRKEQEAKEKELKAEREKAEAARVEQEKKAEKERQNAAEKLRKEQEAKAKIEAELKAKQEAELKAQKEKELAEKKAKSAPDKTKLLSFSKEIKSIELPELTTVEAKEINKNIKTLIEKLTNYINQQAEKL